MLFTPNDVFQTAMDQAVRKGANPLPPLMMARTFNDCLRRLVLGVIRQDDERLAEEVTVSNADVIADPNDIDITASATREWLHIGHADWRAAAGADYLGDGNEVVLGTIEARHRLEAEFGHLGVPLGYLHDRMRTIKKVSGWDGVYDVRIYGVLHPVEVDVQDPASDFARVFDYPAPLFDALCSWWLVRVAVHLKPSELELTRWQTEFQMSIDALGLDALFHVGDVRVDDIGHQSFYL